MNLNNHIFYDSTGTENSSGVQEIEFMVANVKDDNFHDKNSKDDDDEDVDISVRQCGGW